MNDQFFQQKNERKYIRLTQCYDQLYDELFRMEAHAHEGIELMFVREGRINFFFSVGGMVKQYSIAADEFVIFDSTIPHRLEVEKCAHILNFRRRFLSISTAVGRFDCIRSGIPTFFYGRISLFQGIR